MTDNTRPVCDYPEPCACYAEVYAHGKEKAISRSGRSWTPTTPTAAAANRARRSVKS